MIFSSNLIANALAGFNSTVQSFVIESGYLYCGGGFTSYTSPSGITKTCQCIAKINLSSGEADPSFNSTNAFNQTVNVIVYSSGYLYCGGAFTSHSGNTRQRIAKISASTGDLDSTFDTSTGFNNVVRSIEILGSDLYVAGSFTSYKSTTRQYIAKLSDSDASLSSSFNTSSGFNSAVYSLVLSGAYLYVGGGFTTYKSTNRRYVAKINLSDASLDSTFASDTGFNGVVNKIALSGSSLLCAGSFTSYKSTARQRVAKIDASTAALDSTFDSSSGFSNTVNSFILDSSNLYCVGSFTQYKSQSSGYLTKIDLSDASFISGYSGFNSSIQSVILSGSSLICSGNFTRHRGIRSLYLANIDKTSGNRKAIHG